MCTFSVISKDSAGFSRMQVKHSPKVGDMVLAVWLHIWQVAMVVRPFDFGLRILDFGIFCVTRYVLRGSRLAMEATIGL
jgi:hypothetical protein